LLFTKEFNMTPAVRLAVFALSVLIGAGTLKASQWNPQTSGTTSHLRGISAVSSSVAWASGANGTWLRTTNGGRNWKTGTVPDTGSLDFRDVEAIDATTAFLMATVGRIYKTADAGRNWSLKYNNTAQGVFLDSIAFWDRTHGIALGDPMNGRFLVVLTENGGDTWTEVEAAKLPPSLEGEAAFAASGTCIALEGKNNAWFATGGKAARVFRSTDRGRSWTVHQTPIISGKESTGIFAIAFQDSMIGIVVGGDYREQVNSTANAALTTDGGATWRLVEGAKPGGFRSDVAYVPTTSSVITVGESGCDVSSDGGKTWRGLGKQGFHAISFGKSGTAWAVGAGGKISQLDRSLLH
jgi:photosystem II stability/assembly factor-like uncharacterized protein